MNEAKRRRWWRGPLIGVRRADSADYLFITLVAFAITVVVVRVYLDLSGYPKIGGGGLHVAHMLWGGLLLVAAVIVLQMFVGRRAMLVSAIAAGVGVGLFIDEVGKFITESNDYFFAPAAPIIYGAFLLLALLWVRTRDDGVSTAAEAKQAAIEALGELAVGRLSRHDRDQVVGDLRALAPADGPDGPDRFASELVTLLVSPDAEAQLRPGDWAERGGPRRLIRRLLPDALERWLIRIGLFLAFLSALLGALVLAVVVSGQITAIEVPPGPMEMPTEPIWVGILAVVWVVVGLACGWALVLSLARRHERAMGIARYAILLSLVAGGLLNLYISQLGALSDVIVQFVLLLLILDQRTRLSVQPQSQAAAGSGAA